MADLLLCTPTPLPTALHESQRHMAWVPSLVLPLTNWKTRNVCVASPRLCCLISERILIILSSDEGPSWDSTPESPIRALIDWTVVILIVWGERAASYMWSFWNYRLAHTSLGHLLCSPSRMQGGQGTPQRLGCVVPSVLS